MRTLQSWTGTQITCVGSATDTKSDRSEFVFRPVPCKHMKRNVWRAGRTHAGLSLSRSYVITPLDWDYVCQLSYFAGKSIRMLGPESMQVCFCQHWTIPENIHTIPRKAFWNSKGKEGFFELEIRKRGGMLTTGILKARRGLISGIFTADRQYCSIPRISLN